VAERGRVGTRTVRPERRRTIVQALIATGFLAFVAAFVALVSERHGYFDLGVYDGAMNYWIKGGGQLYDYLLPNTEYGFTYPTFAAVLMAPMAFLNWHVVIAISLVMTLSVTGWMIYTFVAPIARRQGWTVWFAVAIAAGLFAAFEPVRETVSFGQVNLLLLFLVAADVLVLLGPGRRFGGIGIGLATAIKLTPGIFILWLLVTRRWRAAAVASATAAATTWFAATVAPDASRVFWTDAVWDTSRVGSTAFISNQSLMGFVSRLNPPEPSKVLWLALTLIVLVAWAYRARQAHRANDEMAGLALTGVVGCLVSPITWIHHLVWAIPAIVLLFDHAFDAARGTRRERRNLFIFAAITYAILCSRLVWPFHAMFHDWGVLGSNAYVILLVMMLFVVPIRTPASAGGAVERSGAPTAADVPDLAELDRKVTAAFDAKDRADERLVDA
jgi:alpha-1,2-mannosyltransferase